VFYNSIVSPFFNMSSAVAARRTAMIFISGLVVLILCISFRRCFCRWLCPVGLACEVCAKARKKRPSLERVPSLGQFFAAATLAGAILSAPFFLMADPIYVLSGALDDSRAMWIVFMAILAIIILTGLVFPGLWCLKICPLGGMQDILAVPRAAIKRGEKKEKKHSGGELAVVRRSFLGLAAGVAGGFVMRWIISPLRTRIRPPGAATEREFKTLCIRCGNCVRVCPVGIIGHDGDSPDTAGILAPMISFEVDYCRQDCNSCGQNCPTGAIESLSLEDKNLRKMAIAKVDDPACRLSWDVQCDVCLFACPCEAIEGVFNREDDNYKISIVPEKCNGCGRCKLVCPEKAISMEVLPCGDS
jgi:ferredoxin